jgi:hypothetical protein
MFQAGLLLWLGPRLKQPVVPEVETVSSAGLSADQLEKT